MPVIYR